MLLHGVSFALFCAVWGLIGVFGLVGALASFAVVRGDRSGSVLSILVAGALGSLVVVTVLLDGEELRNPSGRLLVVVGPLALNALGLVLWCLAPVRQSQAPAEERRGMTTASQRHSMSVIQPAWTLDFDPPGVRPIAGRKVSGYGVLGRWLRMGCRLGVW